jgi:hypothetical protein
MLVDAVENKTPFPLGGAFSLPPAETLLILF